MPKAISTQHYGGRIAINCRVRRFWQGEDDQIGQVVHKPGGQEHARWVFDYDRNRVDDDEAGYRFGAHVFVAGRVCDDQRSGPVRITGYRDAIGQWRRTPQREMVRSEARPRDR